MAPKKFLSQAKKIKQKLLKEDKESYAVFELNKEKRDIDENLSKLFDTRRKLKSEILNTVHEIVADQYEFSFSNVAYNVSLKLDKCEFVTDSDFKECIKHTNFALNKKISNLSEFLHVKYSLTNVQKENIDKRIKSIRESKEKFIQKMQNLIKSYNECLEKHPTEYVNARIKLFNRSLNSYSFLDSMMSSYLRVDLMLDVDILNSLTTEELKYAEIYNEYSGKNKVVVEPGDFESILKMQEEIEIKPLKQLLKESHLMTDILNNAEQDPDAFINDTDTFKSLVAHARKDKMDFVNLMSELGIDFTAEMINYRLRIKNLPILVFLNEYIQKDIHPQDFKYSNELPSEFLEIFNNLPNRNAKLKLIQILYNSTKNYTKCCVKKCSHPAIKMSKSKVFCYLHTSNPPEDEDEYEVSEVPELVPKKFKSLLNNIDYVDYIKEIHDSYFLSSKGIPSAIYEDKEKIIEALDPKDILSIDEAELILFRDLIQTKMIDMDEPTRQEIVSLYNESLNTDKKTIKFINNEMKIANTPEPRQCDIDDIIHQFSTLPAIYKTSDNNYVCELHKTLNCTDLYKYDKISYNDLTVPYTPLGAEYITNLVKHCPKNINIENFAKVFLNAKLDDKYRDVIKQAMENQKNEEGIELKPATLSEKIKDLEYFDNLNIVGHNTYSLLERIKDKCINSFGNIYIPDQSLTFNVFGFLKVAFGKIKTDLDEKFLKDINDITGDDIKLSEVNFSNLTESIESDRNLSPEEKEECFKKLNERETLLQSMNELQDNYGNLKNFDSKRKKEIQNMFNERLNKYKGSGKDDLDVNEQEKIHALIWNEMVESGVVTHEEIGVFISESKEVRKMLNQYNSKLTTTKLTMLTNLPQAIKSRVEELFDNMLKNSNIDKLLNKKQFNISNYYKFVYELNATVINKKEDLSLIIDKYSAVVGTEFIQYILNYMKDRKVTVEDLCKIVSMYVYGQTKEIKNPLVVNMTYRKLRYIRKATKSSYPTSKVVSYYSPLSYINSEIYKIRPWLNIKDLDKYKIVISPGSNMKRENLDNEDKKYFNPGIVFNESGENLDFYKPTEYYWSKRRDIPNKFKELLISDGKVKRYIFLYKDPSISEKEEKWFQEYNDSTESKINQFKQLKVVSSDGIKDIRIKVSYIFGRILREIREMYERDISETEDIKTTSNSVKQNSPFTSIKTTSNSLKDGSLLEISLFESIKDKTVEEYLQAVFFLVIFLDPKLLGKFTTFFTNLVCYSSREFYPVIWSRFNTIESRFPEFVFDKSCHGPEEDVKCKNNCVKFIQSSDPSSCLTCSHSIDHHHSDISKLQNYKNLIVPYLVNKFIIEELSIVKDEYSLELTTIQQKILDIPFPVNNIKSLKNVCVNAGKYKNYDDSELMYYKHDDKVYCISKFELSNIALGDKLKIDSGIEVDPELTKDFQKYTQYSLDEVRLQSKYMSDIINIISKNTKVYLTKGNLKLFETFVLSSPENRLTFVPTIIKKYPEIGVPTNKKVANLLVNKTYEIISGLRYSTIIDYVNIYLSKKVDRVKRKKREMKREADELDTIYETIIRILEKEGFTMFYSDTENLENKFVCKSIKQLVRNHLRIDLLKSEEPTIQLCDFCHKVPIHPEFKSKLYDPKTNNYKDLNFCCLECMEKYKLTDPSNKQASIMRSKFHIGNLLSTPEINPEEIKDIGKRLGIQNLTSWVEIMVHPNYVPTDRILSERLESLNYLAYKYLGYSLKDRNYYNLNSHELLDVFYKLKSNSTIKDLIQTLFNVKVVARIPQKISDNDMKAKELIKSVLLRDYFISAMRNFATERNIRYISDEQLISLVVINPEFKFEVADVFVNFMSFISDLLKINLDKDLLKKEKIKLMLRYNRKNLQSAWDTVRLSLQFKDFVNRYFSGFIEQSHDEHKDIFDYIKSTVYRRVKNTDNLEKIIKDPKDFADYTNSLFDMIFSNFPTMKLTSGNNFKSIQIRLNNIMKKIRIFYENILRNENTTNILPMNEIEQLCSATYTEDYIINKTKDLIKYKKTEEMTNLNKLNKAKLGFSKYFDTLFGDESHCSKLIELQNVYFSDQNKISRIETIIDDCISEALTADKISDKDTEVINNLIIEHQTERLKQGYKGKIEDIDVTSLVNITYDKKAILRYIKQLRNHIYNKNVNLPIFPVKIQIKKVIKEDILPIYDYMDREEEVEDPGFVEEDNADIEDDYEYASDREEDE